MAQSPTLSARHQHCRKTLLIALMAACTCSEGAVAADGAPAVRVATAATTVSALPPPMPTSTPSPSPTALPAKTVRVNSPELIPVTRVVGELADRIVTSREVRMNRAVEAAMSELPSASRPTGEVVAKAEIPSGQEKSFSSDVGAVLEEWMIFLEARSLSPAEFDRAEVARAIKAVQDKWGAKADWQDLDPTQDELTGIVERKLIAREFLKLKSDSSLVPVTESDALQYFRRNRLRFGGVPFLAVKENVKSFLIKQQTEKRLQEWKDVLRRKYKVRNFLAA